MLPRFRRCSSWTEYMLFWRENILPARESRLAARWRNPMVVAAVSSTCGVVMERNVCIIVPNTTHMAISSNTALWREGKERNVLFNDALNTFYLRLCGRKEMFYLTTHSTHFIYGYMASDICLRTILIVRKETRCRHMGYSARVLLYAPSHRQENTYHGLCYTSRGALAGTRNSSMGKRKDMFYLTTHSTHFIYGYMASDIWLRSILIVRKETRCRHSMGYSSD